MGLEEPSCVEVSDALLEKVCFLQVGEVGVEVLVGHGSGALSVAGLPVDRAVAGSTVAGKNGEQNHRQERPGVEIDQPDGQR